MLPTNTALRIQRVVRSCISWRVKITFEVFQSRYFCLQNPQQNPKPVKSVIKPRLFPMQWRAVRPRLRNQIRLQLMPLPPLQQSPHLVGLLMDLKTACQWKSLILYFCSFFGQVRAVCLDSRPLHLCVSLLLLLQRKVFTSSFFWYVPSPWSWSRKCEGHSKQKKEYLQK